MGATIGVAAMCRFRLSNPGNVWFWIDWWLGEALGALVIGPAILTAATERLVTATGHRGRMFASLSVAVSLIVFGLPLGLASHRSNVIVFSVAIAAAAVGGGADVMTAGSAGEALHLLAGHR